MRKMRVVALTAALVAAGLVGGGVLPSAAQVPPPPIAAEFLTPRSAFTDDVILKVKVKEDSGGTQVVKAEDPSRTIVGRYTIQPGAQFPWHSHAGPVIVNVAQGSLVYVGAEDCDEHEYATGSAFVDLGHGHVHSAYNPSDTDVTVLVATFFETPAVGSLLIPASAPAGCTLP
ncbi:MAG TPA: cupin domain-containing protein [Actinomycetota bacterium]|nr:cupin domain-containing protein [Actinomycetota bacterium]